MSHSRLSLALDDTALALPPEGRIAVFAPGMDADLSSLPKDRVHILQGFYPASQYWASLGFQTGVTPDGDYSAAVVFLPRAKALARAMVCDASRAAGGGLVLVDGQKTDGIDSLSKALRAKVTMDGVFSKAHGKLLWFSGGDFSDWAAKDTTLEGGYITRPGVFSADGVDKGSAALVAALPAVLKGRVADFGAGWGYLAREVLKRDDVTVLDLVEADHSALDCARENISDPRAAFIWGDATRYETRAPYDVVISNPPFHTGRAGDPALGRAFIRSAASVLKPAGHLWIVANRHLPYEATLNDFFREVTEVGGTSGFKVFHAAKPRRNPR